MMMVSDDWNAERPVENFSGIVVLSLPAIISTSFFLVLVALDKFFGSDGASRTFDAPHVAKVVVGLLFLVIYLGCYCGAYIAPMFLPLAAQQAFGLTRLTRLRSRKPLIAWIFVGAGVLASTIFWVWLRHLDWIHPNF